MTKVNKVAQRSGSRPHKSNPHSLRSFHSKIEKDSRHKKQKRATEKKEWRDAKCSVCMEYPHNAVLLLCSSYHKGCHPYMCATSHRYSNCLDQYKKAYTNPNSSSGSDELLCPLCRGQVKGWTVVKRARKFFNSKKRSCMKDNCPFVGSYSELRKHVRAVHPLARPREVDPSVAEKWKELEDDRELNDVMSTINSTMPGSIIMGDYVIEGNYRGVSRNGAREINYFDTFFRSRNSRDYGFFEEGDSSESDDDDIDLGPVRDFRSRLGRRFGARMFSSGPRRRMRG